MADIEPGLPPELLFAIFDHLPRDALVNCAKVNSHFATIAKPLLYKHGIVTKWGVAFPYAQNPLPFSDCPYLTHGRLSLDQQALVTSRIERLDVTCRLCPKCGCISQYVVTVPQVTSLKVLHMSLSVGEDERCEPSSERQVFRLPFLNKVLEPHAIDKLVWHSSSVHYFEALNHFDGRWGHLFREVVFVLPSWLPNEEIVKPYHRPVEAHCEASLWLTVLDWWSTVTVVFWTDTPGELWLPACVHRRPDLQKALQQAGLLANCAFAGGMWGRVMSDFLKMGSLHLRFVNGSASLSDGVGALRGHGESPAAEADRYVTGFSHKSMDILTMRQWMESGEWEDVFTRKEMRHWLELAE